MRPALSLDLALPGAPGGARTVRVALHGRTSPLLRESTPLVLQTRGRVQQGKPDQFGRAIDAWLDLVLTAAGRPEGTAATEVGLLGAASSWFVQVLPIAHSDAVAYLRALLGDLFGSDHDYLFPRDIVLRWAIGRDGSLASEVKRELRSDRTFAFDGPVPHPSGFPVPSDADAEALLDARFGLFRRTVAELDAAIPRAPAGGTGGAR